jgi:hypothetical protein
LFNIVFVRWPPFARNASDYVVNGGFTLFFVCAAWVAMLRIGAYRRPVTRLQWLTTPPFESREGAVHVRGSDSIDQCMDDLVEVVAVKFVPCELQPEARAIVFEDWSEMLELRASLERSKSE